MFPWGDQKEPTAEKMTFPLNTVDFPMRMAIFKAMKMDQLVKMAFESLEAAKDIKRAQIRPKVLRITFGEYRYQVKFDLDNFSVTAGKEEFREEYMNEHVFFTKTFSGEILDKCVSNKTSVHVSVQCEANFTDVVKNVYKFLCDLFCEPTETNLIVTRKLAYLYPIINSIRKITSPNSLSLWGCWGSEEDDKAVFDGILEMTTFNSLEIHDEPPVGSKLVKFTANSVLFYLYDSSWLSEPRLQEVDAKEIILRPLVSSNLFAARFNFVLKSWHQGTGFQRLESITFYDVGSRQIEIAKERLPTKPWNKYRRPGYYCDYETGENGEKMFTNFYDIRTAEDLTNQKGELGTIMVGDCVLKFLVWTQKEVENVRDAYGHIDKARQMHNEKKIELERELEGLTSEKRKNFREARRELYARKELAETIMAIQRCESYMKIIEECA